MYSRILEADSKDGKVKKRKGGKTALLSSPREKGTGSGLPFVLRGKGDYRCNFSPWV